MGFSSRRARFFKIEFQTEEHRDLYDWMYEYSLDHDTPRGQLAWGEAIGLADDHPDWTFWQVLKELRRRTTN